MVDPIMDADWLNAMMLIDGYKLDHRRQYPPFLRAVFSNWTPRSSRVVGQKRVVAIGQQFFNHRYLGQNGVFARGFFSRPVDEVCARYQRRVDSYLGPNDIGTEHIRDLHRLSYMPLDIRAIPEGTLVPLRVPMGTLESTHPDFGWVTNYMETLWSSVLWLPSTSATTAHIYRKMLDKYAAATGGDPQFVPWQGHDFSFRGMQGPEAAALSGLGHLLSFTGTDTLPALDLVDHFYTDGGFEGNGLVGGSVAATEHSVMCAGGQAGELETFGRLLDLYPRGIVSVVSDTWDLWNVLTHTLPALRERIMARDGKLVIRPDSGDPVKIICGDSNATNQSERMGVVRLLAQVFGTTKNAAGYKQLDPHVGVIYGDSITPERCQAICEGLKTAGFASTNMVFGIGSFTYTYVTRDTYGFAMKATQVDIGGVKHDIFKKPVTDNGDKFSACGRLAVQRDQLGELFLIDRATPEQEAQSLLRPVWFNGRCLVHESFKTIRERLAAERVAGR